MSEAPDRREDEDCPSAEVCEHGCDQHPKPVELTEAERRDAQRSKVTTSDMARALDPILYPHLNPLMQDWPRLMQLTRQVRVAFVAFGWVSPEEAKAREAAARREALLEAETIRAEAEQCLMSLRATVARVEALALPDGIWKGDKHVRLTRRDRSLGCDITESYVRVDDLSAAIAEPERDEEGGND